MYTNLKYYRVDNQHTTHNILDNKILQDELKYYMDLVKNIAYQNTSVYL